MKKSVLVLLVALCFTTAIGQVNPTEPDVLNQVQELVKEGDSDKFTIVPFFNENGYSVRIEAKEGQTAYPKLQDKNGQFLDVANGAFNVYDYNIRLHAEKSVFYSAGNNGEVIMFYSLSRVRKLYDRYSANLKANINSK